MNILIIGGGGREHALAWKIAQSPRVSRLFAAPGNPGIAEVATCVPVSASDADGLIALARAQRIDLAVIGPDNPLAEGLADRLIAAGIATFGPTRAAAELEWSKSFTKALCARHGIPTARFAHFTDKTAAKAYAADHTLPIVIKADGLALGKGVVIAATRAEAAAAIDAMFAGAFGAAGQSVVIEEFLTGEEASFFVLSDGVHALPLIAAQDHKRAYDGDQGPNTGGMGTYSPAPVFDARMAEETMARIVTPTLTAMRAMGRPYRGVLFAGLMLTAEGPKLIEYNARFGDPETQVLMLRLQSDLVPALMACASGGLQGVALDWSSEAAVCVVLAARGYPGTPEKGSELRGLSAAAGLPGVRLFHAGTTRDASGRITAAGGRVLNVCATGATLAEARTRAYAAVDAIDWPEGFCRRDIAARACAPKA